METKNKIIISQTILIIILSATNTFTYYNYEKFINYIDSIINFTLQIINYFNNEIIKVYKWIVNQEYDFSLNNREIALIIIILLISTFLFTKKDIRKASLRVFKVLTSKTAIKLFGQIAIYTILITIILYKINFWNTLLIKDSIIWYFFTALYLTYKAIEENKNEKVYRNIVLGTFKITVLFQFFQNLYPFSIIFEIVLLFTTIIIVLMKTCIETGLSQDDTKILIKLFDAILSIIGMTYIIRITIKTFQYNTETLNLITLKSFSLPIIYNLLFIPFIAYLVLYSLYEILFIRLNFNEYLSKFQKVKVRIMIILETKLIRKKIINLLDGSKFNLISIDNTNEIKEAMKTI